MKSSFCPQWIIISENKKEWRQGLTLAAFFMFNHTTVHGYSDTAEAYECFAMYFAETKPYLPLYLM